MTSPLPLGRGRGPRGTAAWEGEVLKLYDEATAGATSRARSLRRSQTDAERHLWRALREALPGYKWRRQLPVGAYVADLACLSERLIVEVDGGQHTPEADAARTRFLKTRGFRILRFWNNDVLTNTAGVLEVIADSLSPLGEGGRRHSRRKGEVLPASASPEDRRTSPLSLSQVGEGA